jgi:hypothetical protein
MQPRIAFDVRLSAVIGTITLGLPRFSMRVVSARAIRIPESLIRLRRGLNPRYFFGQLDRKMAAMTAKGVLIVVGLVLAAVAYHDVSTGSERTAVVNDAPEHIRYAQGLKWRGAARRIPDSVQGMRSRDVMNYWSCPYYQTIGRSNLCTGGAAWDTAKAHAVIWGESTAAYFLPLLDVAGKEQNVSISLIGACSPIVGNGNMRLVVGGFPTYMDQCDKLSKDAMDVVTENRDISLVILAAAWASGTVAMYKNEGDVLGETNGLSLLKAGLDHLLPQVFADGRTVVIMSEIPKWFADPIPCAVALQTHFLRSASFREKCRDKVRSLDKAFFEQYQRRADDVLRSFNGKDAIVVWSPVDYLCKDQSCTTMINGEFIYKDEGHLRRNLREQTKVELSDLLHFGNLLELAKRSGIER